jgi:hypothetical protein
MAVTINEFEVVPAPEPLPETTANTDGEGTDEDVMSLEELEVMLQREMERIARVRAH